MSSSIQTGEHEEWAFSKPEFMPSSEAMSFKFITDSEDKSWLLFERAYSWATRPSSARLTIENGCLNIAVRLSWTDDTDVTVPAGEVKVAMCHEIPGFDSSPYGAFSKEAFGVPVDSHAGNAKIV